MTVIAKNDACDALWQRVFGATAAHMRRCSAHPSRVVVLVPYAQLMPWAQHYWGVHQGDGFSPRFETTRNWARRVAVFVPQGDDYGADVARDTLTARSLLERAGLSAQQDELATALQLAASQLAPVVAAIAPDERAAWSMAARALLPTAQEGSALQYEAIVARIAMEWVLVSRHATDALFDAGVLASVDALVVLEGFQVDALATALQARWCDKAIAVSLASSVVPLPANATGRISIHAAQDAEDEAQRAAACVLSHLQAGRTPIALAANDRAVTRRIAAHLTSSGVVLRDENGWTLSTTRAAAQLMAALKACAWNASTDAVLDWIKQAPDVDTAAVNAVERALRKASVASWSGAVAREWLDQPDVADCVREVQDWRANFSEPRSLVDWLTTMRMVLAAAGQWDTLAADAAGLRVLNELRLQPGQEEELAGWSNTDRRMVLADFTRWVNEVLEAARYVPPDTSGALVVVLPMPQVLARPFAALVLPGCDEKRLQPAPEPQGDWTAVQRRTWALPTRESLEMAQRAAWRSALQTPVVDLLWRTGDEGGEPMLASALVLALELDGSGVPGVDARTQRTVVAVPTVRPQPDGRALPVRRLSSTAYSDLRHCPYRFFALRQLGLQESDELAAEVDKRDFGNWLHAVLQRFHEDQKAAPSGDTASRVECMNLAAQLVTHSHGLSAGDFLPFAAGWPQVRDGYLHWLAQHEATGATFEQAEVEAVQPLGALQLVGKLDRIDTVSESGESRVLVMDYKTESDTVTRKRIGVGSEDTQLAFYAALLSHDTLRAAYVNVGERGETHMHEQHDVVPLRDLLVDGIQHDFARIAAGDPLPALGEGSVCEYCAARGLCRKDFWT